jgi:hypothetical protein
MKTIMAVAGLAFAVLLSSAAAEETANQCKVRLMETTKLIAVQGDSVANFSPDSDLDTLEVVFLTKPEQGKSRVSDDGQVIYINNATDQEQQALTLQAFDIRVKQGFCSRPHS